MGGWGRVSAGLAAVLSAAACLPGPARAAPAHRATADRATAARHRPATCPHFGRPALAADARPHALRVFAIQFRQDPSAMTNAAAYAHAIDCAIRAEVLPLRARGRPNLVVFDEDVGLEVLATGVRGASARHLLRRGVAACRGQGSPCATLATLAAIDRGYAPALRYLEPRLPALRTMLGRSFIAATDTAVQVFMGTMAAEARRYGVYIVASNTQAPATLTRKPAAEQALGSTRRRAVWMPTAATAYDETFIWAPRTVHPHAPAPFANLLASNRKVPLTPFEQALGFAAGPRSGRAAVTNLRPVAIPGTFARLGFATSLPAFTYGRAGRGDACHDVALTYMRCLSQLGANVVIQADANDGPWSGPDGTDTAERWQPLAWMGSAWRAVSDRSVGFAYAVNPFMVGNLADTPFDGQSAILERGRRGHGCHYVGDGRFLAGEDDPALRGLAGDKPQFLALAPWAVPDGPRAALRRVGTALAADRGPGYVQTAVAADLPFPIDTRRPGCQVAGR